MNDRILVIGSANLDVKGRLLGPPIAGSSNAAAIRTSHGGVARNVAENLARLGAPVTLLTAVGDDTVGDDLLRHADAIGVDISRALRVPGEATGIYLAALDMTGDLALGLDDLRIVERLSSDYLEANADAFEDSDMIVLDMNLEADAFDTALRLARTAGKPVCVDPTSDERAARLAPFLAQIDIITPNMTEAESILAAIERVYPHEHVLLAGIQDPDRALQTARRLVYLGVNMVVVTQAERGACYATEFESGQLPAVKVRIADTTGAGDALTATLIFGLTHDISLSDSVQLGLRAAALTLRTTATVAPELSLDRLYSDL
jgi:pseudouridine kinase